MNRSVVFEQLKKCTSRFPREYAECRARQPALASYPTASAVLDALSPTSPLDEDERATLVIALVNEQQRRPHPLCQAVLLCAFEPMLRHVRRRVGRVEDDDEDLDQTVTLAFLNAVSALPPTDMTSYVPLALRRATKREAFSGLSATHRGPPTDEFDEATHPCDPFDTGEREALAAARAAEVTRVLEASKGGEELCNLLLATFVGEESLRKYVERCYPTLNPKERATTYHRLRNAREKAVDGLRAHRAAA